MLAANFNTLFAYLIREASATRLVEDRTGLFACFFSGCNV